MSVDCSVIILFYNQEKYVKACLNSLNDLSKQISLEIIIADNCSTDKTKKVIKDTLKEENLKELEIRAIFLSENFGFSRACNQLAKLAKAKVLWFLNADALCLEFPKTCYQLALEGAMASPLFLDYQNQYYANFAPFYNRVLFPFYKLFYLLRQKKGVLEVDWLQGACLFVNKEYFFLVGGFLENYFLYTEDMELAYQFYLRGYPRYLVTNEVILHPKTNILAEQEALINQNLKYYFQARHRLSFDFYQLLLVLIGKLSVSRFFKYLKQSK